MYLLRARHSLKELHIFTNLMLLIQRDWEFTSKVREVRREEGSVKVRRLADNEAGI